jgi:hypothetical protein
LKRNTAFLKEEEEVDKEMSEFYLNLQGIESAPQEDENADDNNLLQTIKVPKNLRQLAEKLPAP